jgi:hypothetical protein
MAQPPLKGRWTGAFGWVVRTDVLVLDKPR